MIPKKISVGGMGETLARPPLALALALPAFPTAGLCVGSSCFRRSSQLVRDQNNVVGLWYGSELGGVHSYSPQRQFKAHIKIKSKL